MVVVQLLSSGTCDVNEVEAAGNTPLHSACYEGWLEGVKLLLDMGAKMDASNNAGDRAIHWAQNMGHEEVYTYLQSIGADESQGQVLVPDHVPKVDSTSHSTVMENILYLSMITIVIC